ncbi:MAG: hypothetical protein AMJ77_05245 [Dehalococcoidia bacterium SM23_28_2]|nr:MAG: hypothetical protein AMJ77_05245 [Dehalococcoidia bacterium SM23_28_2]
MVKAWMAFLFTAVLAVAGSPVFVGVTPAAAQDDETATPIPQSEDREGQEVTPEPDVIVPEPADVPEEEGIAPAPTSEAADDETVTPDAGSEGSESWEDAPEPDVVIAPAPDGGEEPSLIEPAPAGETEEELIGPAPDRGEEPSLIAPAPAGAAEEKLIAPPAAGMGQSRDGDGSVAAYGLLALGGLAGLAGVAVLTWRFRVRRA